MKPGTETEDEYVASKKLLLRYLNSSTTISLLGAPIVKTIILFLRCHLFTHESHFCFYKRKDTLHYDEYTNSCHEGTNYGIKHSGCNAKPNMGLERSTKVMVQNGVLGTKRHFQECANSKVGYWSWTDMKCSMKLIKPAVEMFLAQWNAAPLFEVCKISYNVFKVVYKDPEGRKKRHDSHLPLFHRMREVTNYDDVLFCSCGFFQRFGIMCRHIAAVCQFIPKYDEPTHHDFSVRWWKDHMYYGVIRDRDISPGEKILKQKLLSLQAKDIKGPFCSARLISTVPRPPVIPDRFNRSHKSVCVLNYDYEPDIEESTEVPGLSQETNQFENNDNDSFHDFEIDDMSDCNRDFSKNRNAYQSLIGIFKEMTSHIDDTPEARLLIEKSKKMMTQISMEALKLNKDHSSRNNTVVGNVVATRLGTCKKHKVYHSKNC